MKVDEEIALRYHDNNKENKNRMYSIKTNSDRMSSFFLNLIVNASKSSDTFNNLFIKIVKIE